MTVGDLAHAAGTALGAAAVHVSGTVDRPAGRVGIVCGSGGDLGAEVARAGCATLLTGEVKLHDTLAAAAAGLAVVAVGHHASERFSMDVLGRRLAEVLPGLHSQPSVADTDPLIWQAI
jgi:putative NIF3 family GTP cyclohydrolase 1 type 2